MTYRSTIEIVHMNDDEAKRMVEYYMKIIENMNIQISNNMKKYDDAQRKIINAKIQAPIKKRDYKTIDEILDRYKTILEHYEDDKKIEE